MLLTNTTIGTERVERPKGRRISMVEKPLLRELGLAEDINDFEIIQLLDEPSYKRIFVVSLIRCRKITSSMPKLLELFNKDRNNDRTNGFAILEKVAIAEALCDFGNKEWIPVIKTLTTDPNSIINRKAFEPFKIEIAGLLARGGDYSQFEIVASGIGNSEKPIRLNAILALGKFGHKTNPVTESAVELLMSVATSDSIPWLRERAIESLEKIARTKPEVESKVIVALKANKDSLDKDLRLICNAKLDSYNKKLKKEEGN
jgi:hypothetical protein